MRKKFSFFIALCTILCSVALIFSVSGVSASSGITWNTVKTNKPTTSQLRGITWGNNAFIAVGYNGTILKSADGDAWEQKTSGTNITLNDVVWDGTQYIVVGDSGTILASSDGESWTLKSSGITSDLNGIVWNGSQLVTVGDSGTIIASNDGDLWTKRTSGVTVDLNCISWGNNCFCITGTGKILISSNGINWSAKAPELSITTFYDAVWDGSNFIIIGKDGTKASSSDGITWNFNGLATGIDVYAITYNGSKYISVGLGGHIYISTDGNSWSGVYSSSMNYLYDIAWNGSKFVAVGSDGTIVQSDDGETWSRDFEAANGYLNDVVYNGIKFVAVGSEKVCVSSDGANWTLTGLYYTDLYSVTWGNGLFVAVGKDGTIQTSPDGIHWTYRPSGTSNTLKSVIWQGTKFTAVGAYGTVLTSPDGIIWTSVASGLTVELNEIVYGLNQYIAVGEGGYIVTSPDGLMWTKQASGVSDALYSIAYNNQYVAVGNSGIILTSPDGVSWTQRKSGTNLELYDIVWNGNWFVACGFMETTCVSQDGITWASSNQFVTNHFSSIAWGKNKLVAVGDLDNIKYADEPKYITLIHPVSVSTAAGTAPVLPTEVTAEYSDNTTANLPVIWDSIDSTQYEKAGAFTVKGNVAGTTKQATANATVSPPTISVTGVTLDNTTLALTAGGTAATLTATVAPGNATNKAVTWSSSNENVATVANGVVTPVAAGAANITVTTANGNYTDTCTVTVKAAPVISLQGNIKGTVTDGTNPVDGASVNLNAGGHTYSAITTSDGSYTIIDVPVGTGYTITASKAGFTSGSVSVNVTANTTNSGLNIVLTPSNTSVKITNITVNCEGGVSEVTKDKTLQMSALISPVTIKNPAVTWSVENGTGSATISSTGLLTATGVGTVVVRATANDGSGISGIKTITIINESTGSGNGSGGNIPPSSGLGGSLINFGIPADSASTGNPSITAGVTTSITGTTATATTTAQATTDTKGSAAVTVTNAQMTEAVTRAVKEATKLGKGAKKAVVISVKAADNAISVSTTIPKTAVSSIVENEVADLTITTPVVTVTFDDAALEAINKKADGDIAVKLTSLNETNLSDEDKAKVGSRPVYDFSLTSGTKAITSFDSGKAFISIPYTLKPGENSDNIVIYYIDNGKLIKVTHCIYKGETKSVNFETTHFSCYAVGYSTVSFTDVSGWYADSINYLAARGIINGKGSNGFAPNANITRAEFVSILANLAGVDLSQYKNSVFGDVETTAWYNGAVQWAYENGLVAGSNGKFNSNANITRQDMAVIIANYSKKIENHTLAIEKEAVNFADSLEISSYAKNAVTTMQQAGILSGKGSNTFAPKANATRAEAAAMIAELLRGIVE